MIQKTHFANISLLFVAFVWGSTFVIVQNAISIIEPLTFNALRFSLAAIILGVPFVLLRRKQLKDINYKMILSGIVIGVWLFLGYAFQTIGLLHTTTSKAGFITGLSVVMVPLLSFVFLKQKPGKFAIIGVSIATIGLYLLTMTDTAPINIGDGLVFLCAISFAFHIIITGKYSNKFPTLLLTVIQITTVAVLSFISAIIFEDWMLVLKHHIIFDINVVFGLIITSFFATALAFFAQTNFQKFTTPTRVALIFSTEPVFAAATAYIWNNEHLSNSAFLGCVLIFLGMIFAELPKRKGLLYSFNG